MNITVKYFGVIAEATNKEMEVLELEDQSNMDNFVELITSLYPELQGYVFEIALNQSINKNNDLLHANDELALLPPFAGG